MKRITLWLVAASFTFAIGVAASITWFLYRQPDVMGIEPNPSSQEVQEAATIEFCDLLRNYALYRGKIVRVRVRYIGSWEHAGFYDPTCRSESNSVSISFDCQIEESCQELLKPLTNEQNISWDSRHYVKRSDVTMLGRLNRPGAEGGLHFEVVRIERASPIPSDVPWP